MFIVPTLSSAISIPARNRSRRLLPGRPAASGIFPIEVPTAATLRCRRSEMLRVEKGGLEMKKTWLLALVLLGIPALGQSSFDGTWRLEMQKAQFEGVHKMLLKDGVYDCATCDPPIQGFKADGQPHPTSGSPYYDTVVVRVLDDRTVEMSATKNGKLSGRAKETVSADGSTLTIHDSFTSEDGKENSMTEVWKRTGRRRLEPTKFQEHGSRRKSRALRVALPPSPIKPHPTVLRCAMARATPMMPSSMGMNIPTKGIRESPAFP